MSANLTPQEMHYLSQLRSLYPMATDHHLQTSPQFLAYRGQMRARAWTRNNSVNDGTLAKVFERPPSPPFLRDRLCAKCGLVFFATTSPFCAECVTISPCAGAIPTSGYANDFPSVR